MPTIPRPPKGLITTVTLSAILIVAAGLALVNPGAPQAHHLCGNTGSPYGPFDLQTYEDANYKTTYARTFELAGFNQLLHDRPGFQLPTLEVGPREAGSSQLQQPYIPPVLLKSIAWLESGWAQADYSVPYGGVGGVLASHDCGYGIMQVTSGMQNVSGVPNLDQAMIGGHYAFNIARGARILAEKWNGAPEYRPIVGDRNPYVIENWYYALWGYNGFASRNHPLSHDPNRPPYVCDGAQPRGNYPYQELVFGCLAHPPVRGGVQLWPAQEVHLPNPADPAFGGLNSWDAFNGCVYNLQCAPMDIPTPNPWHTDPSAPAAPREAVIGAPALGLSTSNISLLAVPGGQSQTATVTLSNAGTGVLSWRATSSASWLRLSRSQGVSIGGDLGGVGSDLTVQAHAGGLLNGSRHTAFVEINSMYSGGVPAQVQVTLQVAGDFGLSNVQPWPGYSMQAGSWAIGDFNGDGPNDLLHLCCNDYSYVWLANGGGGFSVVTVQPWPGYDMRSGSWQVADFTGDGKADILHLCCNDYAYMWIALGDGRFAMSQVQPWPGYNMGSGSWQAGDFNGDGKVDLIHLCCGDYGHSWLSTGGGDFSVVPFQPWPGYNMQSGAWQAGDFNGDGKGDLFHLCCGDYAHIWLAVGDGRFSLAPVQPWAGYNMQSGSWQIADFSGDGKTDLFHICCGDYGYFWLASGGGAFSVLPAQPWAGYNMQAGFWQAGDIDGDGRADLLHLCCDDYGHVWQMGGGTNFSIHAFQPWPGYDLNAGRWGGGYFNGDNRRDLIHICCQNHAYLWLAAKP